MKITLRPYQTRAVDAIRQAYRDGHRAPLLVLPTGGGKTVVFGDITERAAARGRRVNILVHRQELLRQTSQHLERLGVQHGCIARGNTMTGDLVQVSSVQTLVRRLDRAQQPDLLIIDEAHHAQAGSWRRVLDAWPAARVLGVTATPIRMDGKPLGRQSGGYFDQLIEGPTISELITAGHLSQPVVYGPQVQLDYSQIQTRRGDYDRSQIEHLVDRPTITGCAIIHYRRLCDGVPAIAFCCTVQHAKDVAASFNAAGISALSLDGTMTDAMREYRIQALALGQIQVLTSCDIISEGTDIPVVGAAILLRPTQSTGLFLQQVGRALRPYPGKTRALILDHAGNCFRHGAPDADREWTLDGDVVRGKKTTGEELPLRQCARCYAYIVPRGAAVCQMCGTPVETQGREIEEVAGELIEMSTEEIEALKIRQKRQVGRARSLDDLLEVARQREYDPAWAYRIYNARQAKGRAA